MFILKLSIISKILLTLRLLTNLNWESFGYLNNHLKNKIHKKSECKNAKNYIHNTSFISFCSSDHKESACNRGDPGSIPGSGRSNGEGNGYPLRYSCLGNPMDREAWWVTLYGVTKSQTWLSNFCFSFYV